jgi:hypothetical protein
MGVLGRARSVRRSAIAALLAIGITLGAPFAPANAQPPSLESEIKATFLLRFGLFVTWPRDPPAGQPFTICTIGDSAVSAALAKIGKDEHIGSRPVEIISVQSAPEAGRCAILYVAGASGDAFNSTLENLRGQPVLTVTDAAYPTERGMIHFEVRDGRVRFHIDEILANGAGLKISSRLLNLALSVRQPEAGR